VLDKSGFETAKDRVRERLTKFTVKAFDMLPKLEAPQILDIGCGSGIPTVKLAELSNGQITALDIDQNALDALERKIIESHLSDRVKAIRCSIFDMDFPEKSFDLIWCEGAITPIGFERGLRDWGRLLKDGGFLAVHDERGDIPQKLNNIATCGYELLGYFSLDEHTWKNEYYAPMKKLIDDARERTENPEMLAFLDKEQQEIDVFKTNPSACCSVFFVLRKR